MKIVILTALLLAYAGAQTIEPGKKQYQARCVGCHGDDGTGGGHGPGIVGANANRAATKEAVRDVIRKGIDDRVEVDLVAIGRELDPMGKAAGKICDELRSASSVALANKPARNELGVGINGNPRPAIAPAVRLALW